MNSPRNRRRALTMVTRLTTGVSGVIFDNNTIPSERTGTPSNTQWRNNLFLGQNSAPAIFSVSTFTNYTSSDDNGLPPNADAESSFQWNSPPASSGR